MSRGERDGSLRPQSRFSISQPLLFLSNIPSFVLTRLSGPRFWQRLVSNPDLWICSQELCPLDHRGGQLYSQGRVDPVSDPLLLRKSSSVGNRTRTSGSAARNFHHQTTESINCTHEAEWTPFQIHCFSENLAAPGIEPGPLDLWPLTLTTRPQRPSVLSNI
jgi:hypothetical protein